MRVHILIDDLRHRGNSAIMFVITMYNKTRNFPESFKNFHYLILMFIPLDNQRDLTVTQSPLKKVCQINLKHDISFL